ncbi:MAG TPA: hypothetical protein VMU94_06565 [Streptosporangiaceae bacterium]|nr:hypothetical protein [Streptosporangiaceae bacterium]
MKDVWRPRVLLGVIGHAEGFESEARAAVRAHQGSERTRGESPERASEIAARTVSKERARSGESKTASRSSTRDISSSRRGGLRSHSGAAGPTFVQLYNEARRRGIKGRSSMNKSQLARPLSPLSPLSPPERAVASGWHGPVITSS